MEPTNAEMIGWLVLLVAMIIFLAIAFIRPSTPSVEITWGQRRDWENRAKDYERRTR